MAAIIIPRIFKNYPEVAAGVTTTAYGPLDYRLNAAAPVTAARRRFLSDINLPYEKMVAMQQVHGRKSVRVRGDEAGRGHSDYKSGLAKTDAIYTTVPNIALTVIMADCVPILLYAPGPQAVAAVHSGWQGTARRILRCVFLKMQQEFDLKPQGVKVFIGPAIGPECYVLSNEEDPENRVEILSRHFKKYSNVLRPKKKGLVSFDNKKANFYLLKDLSVPTKNIEISPVCTACAVEMASHWRDGNKRTTSNLAVIGLREHK